MIQEFNIWFKTNRTELLDKLRKSGLQARIYLNCELFNFDTPVVKDVEIWIDNVHTYSTIDFVTFKRLYHNEKYNLIEECTLDELIQNCQQNNSS